MSHPIENLLLPRLDGVRKAPARAGVAHAYRARCPACEGHGQPLSVAETQEGRVLLHCFAGCSTDGVLAAMGLTWADMLPATLAAHRVAGNGGPASWAGLAAAIDGLQWAHCRLLGTCSPAMQAGEIEAAMRAILDAGEAMEQVKEMAKAAMREGRK